MREIKFRAWDIENKRFYHIQLYNDRTGDNFPKTHGKIACLQEYTGLKDKNGKEIYEGDIVKTPDNWDEFGMQAGEINEVYFAHGGFRLKPKYNKKAKGYWLEDDNLFEVIGNIYENPELIENVDDKQKNEQI